MAEIEGKWKRSKWEVAKRLELGSSIELETFDDFEENK